MLNLLTHFPSNCQPRPSQTNVLGEISKAIEANKKFIIVQAPTGAGKSHIAATLCNSTKPIDNEIATLIDNYEILAKQDGSYIHEKTVLNKPRWGATVMTVTKSLQEQYQSLFNNARILKGKQNYICKVDEDFDCDLAPCLLTPKLLAECKSLNRCPMLNARREAWKNKFSVYNYSSFLSLPDFLKSRQLFICDEASELEDELVKYYSCTIEYNKINLSELSVNKLYSTNNGEAYRWLTDFSLALKAKIDEIENDLQNNKKNKKAVLSKTVKYRLYKQLLEKCAGVLQSWYKAEYICEVSKDNVMFTPLYVNVLAQDFFSLSDHVILLSGTIIDHETFASTLGIKKNDYVYIETDSGFDPEKSPIYCDANIKINYKNIDTALPKLVDKAIKICEHFKNDKGIIHTHTFKITEALIKKVKNNRRFLIRETGITNQSILSEHYMREDGTVLISPSLGFGTDLKDDFGRFSIIMKTPYLPLGSERIKKLASKNPQWYEMKALINLVQMCGRTTRNKDDYSDTFILDGTVIDLIKRNKNKLPAYFLKRLH